MKVIIFRINYSLLRSQSCTYTRNSMITITAVEALNLKSSSINSSIANVTDVIIDYGFLFFNQRIGIKNQKSSLHLWWNNGLVHCRGGYCREISVVCFTGKKVESCTAVVLIAAFNHQLSNKLIA
jgi:hypothetical protein